MMIYDCETTRDLLPLLPLRRLDAAAAAAVDVHVARCDECAAELRLVITLQQTLASVPPGLEARVIGAVRRVTPSRRWNPGRLAMAATLAAALIGGSVVFERTGYLQNDAAPMISLETGTSSVSWDAEHHPLLHGGSTLQELSVEELELILAELES